MEIEFDEKLLEALVKAGAKSPVFKPERNYYHDKRIESRFIDVADYPLIRKLINTHAFFEFVENRRILPKLDALEAIASSDNVKKTKVKKLEVLAEAIRAVLLKTPRHWVFKESYQHLLPYFVESVAYVPASWAGRSYTPAYVKMDLVAMNRGKKKEKDITFHRADLPGTVQEILASEGLLLATNKLMEDFETESETYVREAKRTGEQFLARGVGVLEEDDDSYWSRRKTVALERDGSPTKVIMDDRVGYATDESDVADMDFWTGKPSSKDENREEEEPTETVLLPYHPFVHVFNLLTHGYMDVHISYLEPYVYDDKVIDKLVLPVVHKKLIDALTGSAIDKLSDIIRGKAQGIIILCSGIPGTGKTLTAEVYSEVAQRPLYVVQCSQLGTDEEELEKHLAEVLDRATRWKAILLIDEADVYIHERGESIQQNAIVGVFLRLLEYYNGILFLTTNRVTIVDDAILSRTTAHVKYKLPTGDDRERLWKILLKQYEVKPPLDTLAKEAVKAFPKISGRSIRQLIRLALIIAKSENPKIRLNIKHVVKASKFHDFDEMKTEES